MEHCNLYCGTYNMKVVLIKTKVFVWYCVYAIKFFMSEIEFFTKGGLVVHVLYIRKQTRMYIHVCMANCETNNLEFLVTNMESITWYILSCRIKYIAENIKNI